MAPFASVWHALCPDIVHQSPFPGPWSQTSTLLNVELVLMSIGMAAQMSQPMRHFQVIRGGHFLG